MQNGFHLNNILKINFPLVMAPMFLVSDERLIKEAIKGGIMGVFPTLNFRQEGELENVLINLNQYLGTYGFKGNYGVNLIVQRSNTLYKKHLDICVKNKVPFYLTSLGDPREVIEKAHAYGAKVFCDITGLKHARICFDWGCDGFVAVGHGAGGYAGNNALHVLIPAIKTLYPEKPLIASGGIATGKAMLAMMLLGADGVFSATRFIASTESPVSKEYKEAIVNATMDDIIMTERISGNPTSIINTDYAKKTGYRQNFVERFLSRNRKTRKYYKMLVQFRGMKNLERSIKPGNYNNLWGAGQSVQEINEILSCEQIIKNFRNEFDASFSEVKKLN